MATRSRPKPSTPAAEQPKQAAAKPAPKKSFGTCEARLVDAQGEPTGDVCGKPLNRPTDSGQHPLCPEPTHH